jgi:hypothetical protein
MSMLMIYLLACIVMTFGALAACFYFAKRDQVLFAIVGLGIAMTAFYQGASTVNAGLKMNSEHVPEVPKQAPEIQK